MSVLYDQYLASHKANVAKAFEWIDKYLPQYTQIEGSNARWLTNYAHDKSKSNADEYEPYDAYFYGNNRSYKVVQEYNKAWLLHLHRNPHHWQYWVLINDDPKEGEICLDMPYDYILEMICDWWSFSWSKGNRYEIFGWYKERKNYIKLSDRTRQIVEDILGYIHMKLDELKERNSSELMHHGVKGQKWGVKNGPPYPIENSQKSGKMSIRMADEKFTEYALNPEKCPDKARVFKSALGYTKENYKELSDNINQHFDENKLEERGDEGYGMKYQQVMRITGANGKEANVLTAWIKENDNNLRLVTTYITDKEESK